MRRGFRLALLGLALTAAVAAGPVPGRPLLAAHRGGGLLWPENSLLAYRNALGLDVDYLETDVHLTADGEVVVIHDPTLERTSTGIGALRERTLADLGPVRLKTRDGGVTDERVPTLAQLLDLVAPSRAGLLLEIKVDERKQRHPGIEEKVLALVRSRRMEGRTLVMAFERETLRHVRELDPAIRTVLLIGRGEVQRERVWPAESVKWAAGLGATAIGYNHRLIDADVVAAAGKAGLMLAAWTVNEEADVRRMLDLGVDVVISDRPDLVRRLVDRPKP
ncbi:MAG TPA: glycerophosphodiester phosphodiesterase family protein [Methylomirabilota bacterium]|nr:glycerophosphodiester phosphodiesterase family protein [Methylomirabilota bacterium]